MFRGSQRKPGRQGKKEAVPKVPQAGKTNLPFLSPKGFQLFRESGSRKTGKGASKFGGSIRATGGASLMSATLAGSGFRKARKPSPPSLPEDLNQRNESGRAGESPPFIMSALSDYRACRFTITSKLPAVWTSCRLPHVSLYRRSRIHALALQSVSPAVLIVARRAASPLAMAWEI